jgi:TonB-linked SusC/RagA family outer membrane protein
MKINLNAINTTLTVFLLLLYGTVFSQIKVTGVVSASSGEPLPGVSILIKDTNKGTVSDIQGKYQITVDDENAILRFSFIGYSAQEISVKGRQVIDVVLEEDYGELNEVVVTALGMKREKKSLGYAMQEVRTEDFSEVRSENVANMLQGKVAGVQISQSSSGTGGSTRVVMRGLSSLSGNNQPLWVIDGIPVDDGYSGSFDQWGGSDVAGAASEINPDDIESISVLKGPNAAALYGSRAQNGVIVITTKRGKQNQSMQVQYNGNFNWSTLYDGYDYQWGYGQGNGGVFDITSKESWGPEMTGQTIENWRKYYYNHDAESYAMTPQKNRIKDFFRTGSSISNAVSIQGGGENLSARFSFTNVAIEGVTPNNSIDRKYFDFGTRYVYNRLSVDFKGTYTRQVTRNRVALGEYGLMQMFTKMPGNIRLVDLQDNLTVDDIPMNWSGPSNEYLNPYNYVTDKKKSNTKRDRFTGVVSVDFKLNDWLSISGKTGMDYWQDHSLAYGLKSVSGDNPSYSKSEVWLKEVNADIMLKFNKTFNDISVTGNIGSAIMNRKYNSLAGSSGTLVIYGFNNLSNGSSQTASEYMTEKEIQSVLGNVQLGYRNFVFLDITGRNDWSSTLPENNRSYFYPSVSLSGIISEMAELPETIDFLKLRGSWAQVGNDTDPYRLSQTYSFSKINGNIIYATLPTTMPFNNLKPEETKSWEFGLDLRMFKNRIGVDFTYYSSNTINQILSLATPQSTGYSYKYINAGKIESKGVEVMLNTTPVKLKNWQWDLNFNWGTNTTECVELDESVKSHILGEMRIGQIVVREGEKFGDIMSYAFDRDDNGNILVDASGLPIATTDYVKVGNMMPDWTGSVSSLLKFKNLSFNALFDIRYGGDILSVTDALATQSGTAGRTVEGRNGMVVEGIVQSTGARNTQEVTAEQYWSAVGGPYGIGEAFIYDASYVKVREISLGYTLPQSLLQKVSFVKAAKISLVGRDLFYLFRDTPGTNPEGASTRQDWAQGFELNSLPPTRNFGFNVNLTF